MTVSKWSPASDDWRDLELALVSVPIYPFPLCFSQRSQRKLPFQATGVVASPLVTKSTWSSMTVTVLLAVDPPADGANLDLGSNPRSLLLFWFSLLTIGQIGVFALLCTTVFGKSVSQKRLASHKNFLMFTFLSPFATLLLWAYASSWHEKGWNIVRTDSTAAIIWKLSLLMQSAWPKLLWSMDLMLRKFFYEFPSGCLHWLPILIGLSHRLSSWYLRSPVHSFSTNTTEIDVDLESSKAWNADNHFDSSHNHGHSVFSLILPIRDTDKAFS